MATEYPDLYCSSCCINLLRDDDETNCECCACERLPNDIMFKKEKEADEGGKKGPIKKHMGFYKKLKSILNPIKDASNDEPKMETIEMKDCCGCDMPVNETRPLTCEEEGCDNIFCDDCAPENCEDCNGNFCDDCEHLVECDDCLRLHCPEVECEDCAYDEEIKKKEEEERAEEEEEEGITCFKCDKTFARNSRSHDEMICNKMGEKWICADCYDGEYDDKEGDDAEWDECYGVKTTKTKVYIMAGGGSHWWNYVVEFDDEHGEQLFVYKENKDGREQQFRMRLAYRHKDGVEELRLVPLDWQPAEDKDEGLVTY